MQLTELDYVGRTEKSTRAAIVLALAAFAAVGMSFGANVWHVNNRAPNASDDNPGTEAEPFRTINAATTNENFTAGDTVYVHPGVYNEGKVPTTEGPNWASRVYLPKQTYLIGTGRADEVFIQGVRGSDNGMGNSTVRCISIAGTGSVVSNLTICNGGTKNQDANTGSGGGVYAPNVNSYIVDCVISNCAAQKGGGIFYCTAIRCHFINDTAYGSSSGNSGSAGNYSQLFNCVIENCSGTKSTVSHRAALAVCKAVNCTLINCQVALWSNAASYYAYNTVFCGITEAIHSTVGSKTTVKNCVTLPLYSLVGPGVNDYRLIGSAEDFPSCSATDGFTRPAVYTATDFAGNPFPASGTCLPGAVQGTAVVRGGAIQASGDNLVLDGKRMHSGGWVFAEAWPTQFHVSASVPAGQHLWAFSRAVAKGGRMYPQMDDTIWFTPSPETANVVTVQPLFASAAYYVNPDPDVGSNTNDGLSAETPFATLQKAMSKCDTSAYSVIYAAEGDYNQGGGTVASGQSNGWTLTNRVNASTAGYMVRLKGAGVGRSFISGAPDPNTGGAGPGASRYATAGR